MKETSKKIFERYQQEYLNQGERFLNATMTEKEVCGMSALAALTIEAYKIHEIICEMEDGTAYKALSRAAV